MLDRMRSECPASARPSSKIRLQLKTPDGDGWDLTVSVGMERFIGHYSQVPGLRSESRLLDYRVG